MNVTVGSARLELAFKEPLTAAAALQHDDPLAFVSNPDIFGDLKTNERFAAAYTRALLDLHSGGARTALEHLTLPSK